MESDREAQATSDAFDFVADLKLAGLYPDDSEPLTGDGYAGSIFEAVDNMTQRELDHLKGRECHPDDRCSACDKIRAYYAALEAETEARNVYTNLQQNPVRDRSSRLAAYNRSLRTEHVPGLGWIRTTACYCCASREAHHRQWQKRLSKQTTLRSHRPKV